MDVGQHASSARFLNSVAVLELGQVGGDGHHHPEDRRDEREQRDRPQRISARRSLLSRGRPSGGSDEDRGCRGVRGRSCERAGAAACVRRRPGRRTDDGRRPAPRARPDSSIGAMTPRGQTTPRFLARNAVDCLPAGGARAQARARGPPAARQARPRPDGARHPPRPHGRAAQAARVPGPRPRRRPDHRRLHRPRRRSQRALVDAPAAVGRGDRRQRADVRRAGREGARPRAARAAPQLRVARHARWRSCSRSRARRRSPRCSSATTSPSATRRASRSRARAALSADAGLRLGRRARRRRARRHRPEVQPAARPRRPARLRRSRAGRR